MGLTPQYSWSHSGPHHFCIFYTCSLGDPNDLTITGTNFRCGNGQIISLDLICNGDDDCESGEDETNSICDSKLVEY